MFHDSLLDRILWSQLARVVHGSLPAWEPDSAGARAVRDVLGESVLDPEESRVIERWDGRAESPRELFDRLLQARVNRAVREGARVEAEKLGLAEPPRIPKVLIVRGGLMEGSIEGRGKTVVHSMASLADVAQLAPGEKLDQLVDLLVLANQDGAESLRETLGASATVSRADDVPHIDLLLASPTPSIQVLDIERELARLEEVLRQAIPPEKRPAKSGTWSFGRDLTGELLGGKYRIKALKGKGAFKTVYEGEDEMLGARVAVAVLNPKGARSPRALEHFQEEARKLTTIDHENIVRWVTFDRTSEGLHYFVMEYLDGEELETVLRRERHLAPKRVASILLQVLAALRRAHSKGKRGSLLHLDLKPENVFLMPALVRGEPERVKVIDFGIGQHVGAEVRAAEHPELQSIFDLPVEDLGKSIASIALPEDEERALTNDDQEPRSREMRKSTSSVERARGGTLLYASPEQCKHLAGHKDIVALDGRSDLYSLGVMAFRMLTGQFPFPRNGSAFEAIENHLQTPPRKVGSLGIKVPRDLASFVDRCLVKDPDKRWKDANEAYEALARIVHPRISPLKVLVPFAALVGIGLAALYFTRDPIVSALTIVDPRIESVSERVVTELFLGPKSPSRRLRLESDTPWGDGSLPEVQLADAASGSVLSGWSVRWDSASEREILIERQEGAKSGAAVLELELGRRRRWHTGRIALHHLGPWRIERALVRGLAPGEETAKLLDPRGREIELELAGDPEGRSSLASIEVLLEGESLGVAQASPPRMDGELARYEGPALDALFTGSPTGSPRELSLLILARDRAGQEEQVTLALRLAGASADFLPATGFVARAEELAALLPASSETLLLPENALRLAANAPSRARISLEPSSAPALEILMPKAQEPRFLSLAELGIASSSEHAGLLHIELDDAPYVSRAMPEVKTRTLAFRFTPVAPEISAELVDQRGLELDLLEGNLERNAASVGESARFLVRTPPGTNLWIEASLAKEGSALPDPVRMSRTAGPFELPLELPGEGTYTVGVRKYVLLAGDERGPQIPPDHVFRLEVDRTPPQIELFLDGSAPAPASGRVAPAGMLPEASEPLFTIKGRESGEPAPFSQRITAGLRDAGLVSLHWELACPDGGLRTGTLDPADAVELPSLLEHQKEEGRYELALLAQDRAGNAARKSIAWQVATAGPEVLLLEPAASGTDRRWALGSGRGFNVRVRASDPNGVAAVRARIVCRGESGGMLELQRAAGDLWELAGADRPSAHPWWTGHELALELVAIDGAGLETALSEKGLVPDLPRSGELVIAPRDRLSETMVEILAGSDYVFGGRSGEGRRPWNVAIPREAMRPFFLDAREVSRGEFQEFLRSGYGDPRWWPKEAAPDAARAAERERELAAALDSSGPITGVTWAEAHAYAAWRGKRLPTLLEWEFAVRGEDYRDAPSAKSSSGDRSGWPVNLCASAREWTSTPERLVDETLDFASQCRRYPDRLISPDPAPLSSSHWVAGSGEGEAPSWSSKILRAKGSGYADVGFRCALDQEAAHSLLDRGNYVVID